MIFKLSLSGSDIAVMAMRHLADHRDTIHSLISINGDTLCITYTLRSFSIVLSIVVFSVVVYLRRLVCERLSYRWAHHLGFSGLDDPGVWAHCVGGAAGRQPIRGQTETDREIHSTHELRWRGKKWPSIINDQLYINYATMVKSLE